jgi:hypothetical protein
VAVDTENVQEGPRVVIDMAEIAGIVRAFFAAFTSGPETATRLDKLRSLFLPDAVIIATCGSEPVVYGVEAFITRWSPHQVCSGCPEPMSSFFDWHRLTTRIAGSEPPSAPSRVGSRAGLAVGSLREEMSSPRQRKPLAREPTPIRPCSTMSSM